MPRAVARAAIPAGPRRASFMPVTRPTTSAARVLSTVTDSAISTSSRVAVRTRENTSIPLVSVPNQCADDGGDDGVATTLWGSHGASSGPTTASTSSSAKGSARSGRASRGRAAGRGPVTSPGVRTAAVMFTPR